MSPLLLTIFLFNNCLSEKFTAKCQNILQHVDCWGCNIQHIRVLQFLPEHRIEFTVWRLGLHNLMKNTFVCNRVHCYKKVSLRFALQKKGNKNIKHYSLNCIERLTIFLYPFHSHSLQTLFCSLRNTAFNSLWTISSDWYRSGNEANVSYIEQYQLVYHANICFVQKFLNWSSILYMYILFYIENSITGNFYLLLFQCKIAKGPISRTPRATSPARSNAIYDKPDSSQAQGCHNIKVLVAVGNSNPFFTRQLFCLADRKSDSSD